MKHLFRCPWTAYYVHYLACLIARVVSKGAPVALADQLPRWLAVTLGAIWPKPLNFQAVIELVLAQPPQRLGERPVVRGPVPRRPHAELSSGRSHATLKLPGTLRCSRLDHGLKVSFIRGGCASSRLDHGLKV